MKLNKFMLLAWVLVIALGLLLGMDAMSTAKDEKDAKAPEVKVNPEFKIGKTRISWNRLKMDCTIGVILLRLGVYRVFSYSSLAQAKGLSIKRLLMLCYIS